MSRLPRPWHAAYDWVVAAGEEWELVRLEGPAFDAYARACVDNFANHATPEEEGFIESDLFGLHAHLVAHLDNYPRLKEKVLAGDRDRERLAAAGLT